MNSLINRLIELDEYGYKAQTGMIGHEAVAEIEKLEAQNAMMQASRSQRIEELERERDELKQNNRDMNTYMHKRIEDSIKADAERTKGTVSDAAESTLLHERTKVLEEEHTKFFNCWHDERKKREALEVKCADCDPVYQLWRSTDPCSEFWSWDDVDKAEYDHEKDDDKRRVLFTHPTTERRVITLKELVEASLRNALNEGDSK